MLLTLTRDVFGAEATLGALAIFYDGDLAFGAGGWRANPRAGALPFGFTCEDQDRGLDAETPPDELRRIKVAAETAIPTGDYIVRPTWSPRYRRVMPLVCGVPGFQGVRLHSGNDERDTAGCVLPGLQRDVAGMRVLKSRQACAWLDARINECEVRGEVVRLVVARDLEAWARFTG